MRPARQSDKKPLMEFIRDVWGGHDYIPSVWDAWISDSNAKMFVVEVDGRPVGMNRVKFVEDGSAWFEGVRVHPMFRGRGLATMLGNNTMDIARRKGIRTFRLTSSSWNHAAHRQIARMGFGEAARISVYQAKDGARFPPQKGVRVAKESDLDFTFSTMETSKEFAKGAGVMWDGFTAISLTREVVSRRIDEKSVYLCEDAVAIGLPGREGKNVWSQVCFVCGSPSPSIRLVKHIFAKERADWKLAYIPQGSPLIGALRVAGFERGFSLILFERPAKG